MRRQCGGHHSIRGNSMSLTLRSMLALSLFGLVILSGGCKKKETPVAAPAPGGPGPGPMMMDPPGGMSGRETGKIMAKIGKGLHNSIRKELDTDPPPWDSIQPKAKEY